MRLRTSFPQSDLAVIIIAVAGAREGHRLAIEDSPMAFRSKVSGLFCI